MIAKNYLPLDKDGQLYSFLEEAFSRKDLMLLDVILDESKRTSKGIAVEKMPFLKDKKLVIPTKDLFPCAPERFSNMIDNNFCVRLKKQELTEKQKQRFLSGTTIHEVHRLLGTAFQYAVEWGILVKSPVPVDSPKKSTQERTIWTVEEMRAALDSMEDPILHLAVHLTLVGALREGEIVGLTPEDLDFDAADGIGTFRINKSMQRVRKEALNQVDDGCIIKVFPDKLERSTTSLILKSTKTASSCRTIFMTSALKEELKKWLNQLATDERKDPTRYHDSGMLFRLPNGLAVEPVLIRKKFLKWQDAHPEFPRIVFHGLRHSSATYQLMISGGDVKAVQGTTGHATADMLVNTYAHIQQSSRVELGKKFEEGFYAKSESPSPQAVPAAGEPTISMTALLELLKNADPEVKAQLRLALLT
jgi:integrase